MAFYDNRKFYWLKLKRDFFKRHDIRVIEALPNGKDYVLFYLKLLLESVDHEGCLRFSDTIPYSEEMLSTITNTNIDIVRSAIKLFQELDMVEILDDKTIFMTEVEALIGCQSDGAAKKQNQRLKAAKQTQKIEGKNAEKDTERTKSGQKVDKCPLELELELDIYNTHKRAHAPARTREEVNTIEQVITTKENLPYTVEDVLSVVKEKAPMCYQRHLKLPDGNERLNKLLISAIPQYTLEEITALFEKAQKTFVKKSNYENCDIIWVFDHKERIAAEEDISTTSRWKEKEQSKQILNHEYSAEDWKAVYTPIEKLDF